MLHSVAKKKGEKKLAPQAMVLQSGVFGRWLGHEGRALMKGIRALIKTAWENPLTPFHHVRTQRKDEQEAGPPPDTESASIFIVDLAPRTRKIRFCS